MKQAAVSRAEWGLLCLIAVVCAVLSWLQYRWTGELSRAEPAMLRAGLTDQTRRLTQSFNAEIRESVSALLPTAQELQAEGFSSAHRARYLEWSAAREAGLFTRICIVRPENGVAQLYRLTQTGDVEPAEWPEGWAALRAAITGRISGEGAPPGLPVHSTLLETPLFGPRGLGEIEWMIFDISLEHTAKKLLPRLVKEYLAPQGEGAYDVSVTWSGTGGEPPVYSTRSDGAAVVSNADVTQAFFPLDAGAPGRAGAGRGRGRGGSERGRWTLAVRHRAGSLDAAVRGVQMRNLITSLILVALLGGTAWVLVRYTARSRRLAEVQFRFAAGVSHDLRTPLTAIRGAAFNLSEGLVRDPAVVKEYLAMILRNAEELTAMIENVLAFSASVKVADDLPSEKFEIAGVLERAAAAMAPELDKTGCRLELNVAPDLPQLVGDGRAVELAFRNLIANAVRHGSAGI